MTAQNPSTTSCDRTKESKEEGGNLYYGPQDPSASDISSHTTFAPMENYCLLTQRLIVSCPNSYAEPVINVIMPVDRT